MTKVRKAVIAAAGMGTRFLPQTKAMPKEMLPIIDKPVIQLVVEGLVKAGVEDIIIVTGPTKRAIEDHFDRSLEFETELRAKGKDKTAERLKSIAELANFIYIRQKGEPKGNARPVLNAAHMLGNEPFFFFFADDFFSGEVSCAEQLLEVYEKTGKSVVALREVPSTEISSYGVADISSEPENGVVRISSLVEKPSADQAPSNLAIGAGYLLTPEVIPILEKEKVGPDGEVRISDAVSELAGMSEVYGKVIEGDYHDTGSPEMYIQTIVDMALKDGKLGPVLRDFLDKRL
ncbi:MAG: UTP--glucose-1-phosphate uridylyltransferase [bacterium]|nr:UTP--glucose-1-phosphate uridylyltransferase [bacterium]